MIQRLRLDCGNVVILAAALALGGCGSSSTLPVDSDAAITRAVGAALAGCGAALNDDGDFDEAALLRAGWQTESRTLSQVVTTGNSTGMQDQLLPPASPAELPDAQSYESSIWQYPRVGARLNVSRNGGPIAERTMAECRLAVRGDDGTAAAVGTVLARRFGRSTATGIRSPGGDWLTPRWFESDIRVRYWRRAQHDIYWVSSADDHVAVEIIAMPDRAALDQWSTSRPAAQFSADAPAASTQ